MAQVFQCDACKKIQDTSANVTSVTVEGKDYDVCDECAEKINKVLSPAPRGRKPADAGV